MRSISNKKLAALITLGSTFTIILIISPFFPLPLHFFVDFFWMILLSVGITYIFTDFVVDKLGYKWMKKAIWLIRGLLLAIAFFLIQSKLVPMIKDIPDALIGNYMSTNGVATEVHIGGGRGEPQSFVINGIHFETSSHLPYSYEDQSSYTVKYLQNSKYVMGIEITSDR